MDQSSHRDAGPKGRLVHEPLISVVVSTHAGEQHIRGCLDMLERQTMARRLEIIVIDSGSPENERSIVEDLQRVHDNIVYVRTARETLYTAWNRALEMSTGKYFANVNVDDWIRDDALEMFALALERYPEADIAYAHWAKTRAAQRAPTEDDAVSFHPPYEPALPLFYCYGGSTQFWRRSSLIDLGGFDASLSACGDLDVLRRLTLAGGNAVLVPQVLEGYFQNPAGISGAGEVSKHEQFAIFARARAETPLRRLYAIDPEDIESVASGWTALGNMAFQVRVPWHEGPLRDFGFAVECYDRALSLLPNYYDALHNRYAVLFGAGRYADAERLLDHLSAAEAARIRGAELALLRPIVEPATSGPVFEDCDSVGPGPRP